ncbi:Uncharacterised protein [Klebsiella quasipneumoniae]|nr:Uncharacterised protein [Klebsiella quasipneumoniae]
MLSEISLNCSSQPSCSSLIAAIWKATLKGVLPSFSESQNRCLPIESKTLLSPLSCLIWSCHTMLSRTMNPPLQPAARP